MECNKLYTKFFKKSIYKTHVRMYVLTYNMYVQKNMFYVYYTFILRKQLLHFPPVTLLQPI